MKKLLSGYTAEVDNITVDDWYRVLKLFTDSNLYQTSSYDVVRFGKKNISHLILKKDQKIISAAQVRILKLRFINTSIAYIRWGPMWRCCNDQTQIEYMRQMIRALRNEYVLRRGFLLRIYPKLFTDKSIPYENIFKQEGYVNSKNKKQERTLLVDLTQSIDEIRRGFHQKWRNCLNYAERNNFIILEGTDDHLFGSFIRIYQEMLNRKNFVEPNDINEFRNIQKDLPQDFKMQVFICLSNGIPSAGSIISHIGNTGIYLFGATNSYGLKNKASYILQWEILKKLKNFNYKFYDLNGINPESNPGTYKFKSGLSGNNGKDVFFLGQFDSYKGIFSYIIRILNIFIKTNNKYVKLLIKVFLNDSNY